MSDLVPGYLLNITTWENDGDNYNTIGTAGLTADEVRFYLHVCKKFGFDVENSFGNEPVTKEVFYNGMKEHIEAYPNPPAKWLPGENADIWFYHDLISDLGIHCTEYGYWRVFEDAQVLLVPTAIKDVTKDFQ